MGKIDFPYFSQASLQDYDDCRRRFYYRYIRKLSWPAAEAQPALEYEKLIQQGRDFHTLVYQYLSGVPREILENRGFIHGKLKDWWESFLELGIQPGSGMIFPEKTLSTHLENEKLIAKFDLVLVDAEGKAVIYDWKTTNRKPVREELANRWQTRLYRFVLAVGGGHLLNTDVVAPEEIKMIYWFANYPQDSLDFNYSADKVEKDRADIFGIIGDIKAREDIKDFDLTPNQEDCKYCVYRSLCDRGEVAGKYLDLEIQHEVELSLDLDQIQEIEF